MAFSLLREKGFLQTLLDKGHEHCDVFHANLRSTSYIHKPFGEKDSELCNWLESLTRPAALFACNDGLALEVSEACQQIGLNIPEDIAILGVDNDEQLCMMERPPLSSIILSPGEIGFRAAQVIDSFIQKSPKHPQVVHLPPKGIQLRQSSDIMAVTDKMLADALGYIRKNAHKPITVEDVCDELMVSRRSLEKRTQKLLGHSPLQEIRRVHVDQAKTLLIETDMTMPQIAAGSGFRSQARLSVVFRRLTGMTPTNYRNQFRTR